MFAPNDVYYLLKDHHDGCLTSEELETEMAAIGLPGHVEDHERFNVFVTNDKRYDWIC